MAVARHEVQTPADLFQELIHARRRAFDERQSADVHVRAFVLLVEERGVDWGEAIEVALSHRRLG